MFDFSNEDYTGENKFAEINPGLNVKVVLEKVSVNDESGDLIFSFKGTEPGNTGSFNHRVWANNFDPAHEYYNKDRAIRTINSTKHVLKAFLHVDKVDAIKSKDWKGFAQGIEKAMGEKVYKDKALKLKIVLNNSNKPVLPTFPDFISSELMPKTFKLNAKLNPNTGQPYERLEPITMDTTSVEGFDSIASTDDAPTPKFG
jgi:hypothetical protein|tara:strand:+ start:627 stop:1229 length:603 start_codon:yes stop_codon:yes gene_type:complete